MSFGEWRAHVGHDDFGRNVTLNIGREVAPNQWDMVKEIGLNGVTVEKTTDTDEYVLHPAMRIPMDLAETLYHALDRHFGHENQDGKVEALEAALAKEQARVDLVITTALNVRQQRPQAAQA